MTVVLVGWATMIDKDDDDDEQRCQRRTRDKWRSVSSADGNQVKHGGRLCGYQSTRRKRACQREKSPRSGNRADGGFDSEFCGDKWI